MLRVELKRILKTRSTWCLFAIAFVLGIFFAFYAVRATCSYDLYDSTGQILKGSEAYEYNKEKYASIKGEIRPELIAEAVKVEHELLAQYGNAYNIPPEISRKVLRPYGPVYTWIYNSFSSEDGMPLASKDISPEQALGFYQARMDTLKRILTVEKYEQHPQVLSYVQARTDNTVTNFNYSYGIGSSEAFYNLSISAFLLTLIGALIATPIFSADYASGADDILRCTRRGRRKLALTKLSSALIVSLSIFIISVGAFLIITYTAFGFDDITSAELLTLGVRWNPESLTAMGFMGMILLSSLLTYLAMTCFTLFLSSKLKTPLVVLAIAIAVMVVPIVMTILGIDWNIIDWIRFCLPSGGLPLAMFIEFASLRFLWLGDFVTWSPYVILIAAAVQIPIWLGLAVRAYNKHEAA